MARRQAVRGKRKPVPAWLWLLGGAVIGAGLAVAIMFTGGLPGEKEEWRQPEPADRPLSDKPPQPEDDPLIPDRDYDFYTILPEMETVIPDETVSERAEQTAPSQIEPGAVYMLQAGSFRDAADADALKARLALQGFVADILTVTINGETWHRVRIGPFDNYDALEQARQRLESMDIETIALKVKE